MADNDRTRYARAALVVKALFSKMLRELALKNATYSPSRIRRKIIKKRKKNDKKFNLNPDEIAMLETLNKENGFNKIDESFMCKLIRLFHLVEKPTHDWLNAPTEKTQRTIGDEVERLRKRRNFLVHCPSEILEEKTWTNFVQEVNEIAQHLDEHLKKEVGKGFQQQLFELTTQPLDKELENKYIEALKTIDDLKEQKTVKVEDLILQIFYGKDIEELIKNNNSATNQDTTHWLYMYIHNVVDKNKAIAALKKAISELEKQGDFVPREAEEGSILIHVQATQRCFRNKIIFENEICDCLSRLLPNAKNYLQASMKIVLSVVKDDRL